MLIIIPLAILIIYVSVINPKFRIIVSIIIPNFLLLNILNQTQGYHGHMRLDAKGFLIYSLILLMLGVSSLYIIKPNLINMTKAKKIICTLFYYEILVIISISGCIIYLSFMRAYYSK